MKHELLNNRLFAKNRQRFAAAMEGNALAIFNSNDEMPTNGDALYPFQQNADLYWLTGIEQEDTMLLLYPSHPDVKMREVLVLLRPNELKEKWDGHRLRRQEATAISGIETIVWLDALDGLLQGLVHQCDTIYLNTNENDRRANQVPVRDYRFIEDMKRRYPLHNYQRAAKILKQLRAIKTPEEIEVVQRAIDITAQTFRRVAQFVQPGVMEYEVEAEVLHEFIRNRASRPAYNSIIASGDRARTLHYISNNQVCENGELLLMDFGASYGGYNADLTRTIPVNGKFSKRQREVYNACYNLHQYAKSILKPGISLNDYTSKVGVEANRQMEKIGLLSAGDIKNQDKENPAYRKYLYHGISHHLGLDVHDLGPRQEPLKAGMLLTVEPGIYIEAEKIGIRIENNVWLTKTGNKDLMAAIPITADDIEAAMRRPKVQAATKK
ncbi:MAG: aminopeptidase P N-terminal domain-containing protein [Bacteroidetes bacterium]|nr:aminopeptidase P N-terminal domain-containing protein [Bacteroidota bacterium]